jgi:large subunit ribosomal protein L13
MKTFSTKPSDIGRERHVIDASDQILGKLATQASSLLMGKHKPVFCRHLDTGDYVVITNAGKIRVTGRKVSQKLYYRHSGYPGGFRSTSLGERMESDPAWVVEHAVRGMLPHNRLGAKMARKLEVYAGDIPQPAKKEPARQS